MILGYLDNVNKGKLRMTASGRFWMLTSTSLIFLVRPMTAMLMKTGSRETTSFGASLRTMRMNWTFRGPLGTTTKPSSTTLDPKLMSPVGLGTSWTSQIRAEIREFFCEIRGGHKYMQQAHAVDFSQGGGTQNIKFWSSRTPPFPLGCPESVFLDEGLNLGYSTKRQYTDVFVSVLTLGI